jgi:hypothetical protein
VRRFVLVLVLLAASLVLYPAAAGATTFSNPAPIAPAVNGPVVTSTIPVSGLAGTVTKTTATISGISGTTAPSDFDVLLIGPGGQNVMLVSDACPPLPVGQMTFDDSASAELPAPGPPPFCSAGTYKPTNYDGGDANEMPGAPAGPYGSVLATFNGTSPNGDWRLLVRDDGGGGMTGTIPSGWSLDITTPPTPPAAQTGQRAAALKKCKKKHSHRKRKKCKKRALKLPV